MNNKLIMSIFIALSISYADLITVDGDINSDVVWTSNNTYYLNSQAFVKDGATLTIEKGTEVVGRYDANYSADNPAPCLVVEQGGMIMAQGTPEAPITFRSELDADDPNYGNGRGLWGGLIINGYAPIANDGGTANVEGLTGVPYGGTDPDDNSGVLRYVRVWNGGSSIAPDNEINGITLAGVGRGTTVEYCEVGLNLDDGFEMFGGTVDLKYCSVIAVGDDAFDTDAGYQGRGQFLLVVRADDSDKGHEMDSKTNGDLDSQPRSHPHFANVTVISSVAHGEDALRLREGTGGDFRNYIIHGANDGVRNDDNGSELVTQDLTAASSATYPDYLYISGSMIMNGLAGVPWDDFDESTDGGWTGTYVSESAGLAMTVDANGLPATLDITPSASGPAFEDVDAVIEDDFFVPAYYKGAFGSRNWLKGWSYLDEAGILFEQDEPVVTLGGDITEDTYLPATGNYYLNEQVFVKDGVTLTIEAGTTIYGRYDANYSADNPAPCLVVEQGGMIMAQGTPEAPITFRSELDADDPNYGNGRGLWGGLIINGYAPIANDGGTANVEGLTGVPYGGTDPDDNSGVLRYVRVWNGGSSIAPDNEINGITLAGVGRGTTVEYCEVGLNLDDGFEMFGGTVDLKYCSVIAVGDDAFDTDAGYQGRGQFLLVVRADDSDKGHEMDSKTNGDLDSQPRSHPHFANVTVISSVAHGEDALRLREGTGGDFRNYIIHGANDGVRNDDNGSELVTQDLTAASSATYPDYLYISGSMIMNGLAGVPWDDFDESTDGGWTGTYVSESAGLAMTVDANGLPATLHVNPPLNSIAFENIDEVIEDDFFTQTNYKGAFSSDSNWLEGWSYLSVAEVLSTDNDKNSIIAQELKLHGNYPNPFNPSTKINFELSGYHDNVTFTVFNVMGQIVNEISFSNTLPGMQVINWNGINSNGASVPSGIYFYQVQAGDLSAMGKMTLVK